MDTMDDEPRQRNRELRDDKNLKVRVAMFKTSVFKRGPVTAARKDAYTWHRRLIDHV